MTTVRPAARWGPLRHRRLPADERRIVDRVVATSRACGDVRLDDIALHRLRRAAAFARLLGPVGRLFGGDGPDPQDRLDRLCCTLRHPSRTGICTGRTPPPLGPAR